MKIVTVVGARPQFIKSAPVSKVLQIGGHEEFLIHTGQHYDYNMSKIFFEEMGIVAPDINLEVGSGDHGRQTGHMIIRIEEVLKSEKPDWVLVYGDTNSTLAGALAAVKLHIPVAHVEAGLRSFNKRMPEVINRVMTDRISNLLFCPSQQAVDNLLSEGIGRIDKPLSAIVETFDKPAKVVMVGDVMYDSFLFWQKHAGKHVDVQGVSLPSSFILATIHRPENTDDRNKLSLLIKTLGEVGKKFNPVVIPIHPRTQKRLDEYAIKVPERIMLLPPVSYQQMIGLLDRCQLVITDSGGLQKEAYFSKKCCITLRDQTEWIETVDSGVNLIAGTEPDLIIPGVGRFISDNNIRSFPPLYGHGDASIKVVKALLEF